MRTLLPLSASAIFSSPALSRSMYMIKPLTACYGLLPTQTLAYHPYWIVLDNFISIGCHGYTKAKTTSETMHSSPVISQTADILCKGEKITQYENEQL